MPARAIEVEGVGKRYRLGEMSTPYSTLREALSSAVRRRGHDRDDKRELWALRDVSLSFEEGEAVGIVGLNGAGKTTLLRLLGHITAPTEGVARTQGRIGTLLEVGAGFHPELTGRENIYVNGVILGMSRREVRNRFDEIVEFSGLERFLDTPLKRYSSGMWLRLAFAVPAHLQPDIMLVDEVLAVGDAEFQRRCLGKMSDMESEGRTVVFVSHDLGAVTRMCSRAVWLHDGSIRRDGPAEEVVNQYLRSTAEQTPYAEFPAEPEGPAQLRSVAVTDLNGATLAAPRRDQPFSLRIRFETRRRLLALDVAVTMLNANGIAVLSDAWSDSRDAADVAEDAGEYEAQVTVPGVLAPGEYTVRVWIGSNYEAFVDRETLSFRLWPHPSDTSELIRRSRVVQPRLDWHVGSLSERDRAAGP